MSHTHLEQMERDLAAIEASQSHPLQHNSLPRREDYLAEIKTLKARVAELEQRPAKGFCVAHQHLADAPVCVWCLEQQQEAIVDELEAIVERLRPAVNIWHYSGHWWAEVVANPISGYLGINGEAASEPIGAYGFSSREDAESAFTRWLVDNGYAPKE